MGKPTTAGERWTAWAMYFHWGPDWVRIGRALDVKSKRAQWMVERARMDSVQKQRQIRANDGRVK